MVKKDTLIVLGGMLNVLLIGGFLALPSVNADGNDTSVSTAAITVPVACTMVGTTNTAHTAEIPNGIDSRSSSYYPNGIGTTTLKAYCNDNEGFAVYAVGYTGDTIGNTYLRDSNLGQTADIATGTADSGATSSWSMRIGVTSGTYTPIIAGSSSDSERQSGDTDYSGWAAVPASYQRVAYRNSGTDVNNENVASAEGASLTTTYAAYISPTQKSGTYVGKVKYTLVHPANEIPTMPVACFPNSVCYNPNGGNVVGRMASFQTGGNNSNLSLTTSNYSREGYGFAGWSATYDYSDPNGFYGPNEIVTTPSDTSTNGFPLYAIWVKSAGTLQDWTGCPALTSGAVTALTDLRDNDTYAVAKLADGNCWMIENLRLDNTNSDNSTGALAQGYGTSLTYGNFSGLAAPETPWNTGATTANSLYSTDGANDTISIGSNDLPYYRFPRYNNQHTASRSEWGNSEIERYNYGNYYTWPAAIADPANYVFPAYYSGTYRSVENTSICPKGWRLPIGGGKINEANNDYWALIVTGINSGVNPANYEDNDRPYYTGSSEGASVLNAILSYPNNFIYAGYIDGTIQRTAMQGHYWTSTYTWNGLTANGLYFENGFFGSGGSVYPGTTGQYRSRGQSIRCMISG